MLAGCLTVAAVCCMANRADAAIGPLTLRLTSGLGPTATIVDNAAGDSDATAGVIVHTAAYGGFNITVNTGFGDPLPGYDTFPRLHLNVVAVTFDPPGPGGPVADTLTIELSQIGYDVLGLLNPFDWFLSGTAGNTASFEASIDENGAGSGVLFGDGTPTHTSGVLGPYTTGNFETDSNPPGGSIYHGALTDFSMTLKAVISHTAVNGQTTSFDFEAMDNGTEDARHIPEPASLAVWGGLSVLGLVFGNRFRRKAA